jgi:hypothetical protein
MADSSPDVETIVVCGDHIPAATRTAIAATCERLGIRQVDWAPAAGFPAVAAEPLLVIAGLARGTRALPMELAAWTARCVPHVPLCVFTEETLVRPSLSLHNGRLLLVGAPLSDLRVSALVTAWIRGRRRLPNAAQTMKSTSLVGGQVTMLERALGPHVVGTFVHDTDVAAQPRAFAFTAIGAGSAVGLAPRTVDDREVPRWLTAKDSPRPDASVVATVDVEGGALDVEFSRDDIEVRLASPDRSPMTSTLDVRSATRRTVLHAEANDLVLVSWPRGAVDAELVGQIMLDGLAPLMSAFELIFRTSPTAFAAAAIQVR